jgi:hypothetical protein
MANFNQKPADKVSSKPNFIKIVLKILLVWILFNAVRIGISDALKQPSYSPSSTSEPRVPPHVQAMHDNMSCDALRHYSKLREWERRGCNK